MLLLGNKRALNFLFIYLSHKSENRGGNQLYLVEKFRLLFRKHLYPANCLLSFDSFYGYTCVIITLMCL